MDFVASDNFFFFKLAETKKNNLAFSLDDLIAINLISRMEMELLEMELLEMELLKTFINYDHIVRAHYYISNIIFVIYTNLKPFHVKPPPLSRQISVYGRGHLQVLN